MKESNKPTYLLWATMNFIKSLFCSRDSIYSNYYIVLSFLDNSKLKLCVSKEKQPQAAKVAPTLAQCIELHGSTDTIYIISTQSKALTRRSFAIDLLLLPPPVSVAVILVAETNFSSYCICPVPVPWQNDTGVICKRTFRKAMVLQEPLKYRRTILEKAPIALAK